MKTIQTPETFQLESAGAILQDNKIKVEFERTLQADGMELTALHVYDYSLGFNETFKKVSELLPFVRVRKAAPSKILITTI
jgi:hypothetical protein